MESRQNPCLSGCAVCKAAPSQLRRAGFDIWQCKVGMGSGGVTQRRMKGEACWWAERSPWQRFPRSAQPWDLPCTASPGNWAKVSFRAVFWFGVSSCFHGREFPFLTKDERKKKKKERNFKKKKTCLEFWPKKWDVSILVLAFGSPKLQPMEETIFVETLLASFARHGRGTALSCPCGQAVWGVRGGLCAPGGFAEGETRREREKERKPSRAAQGTALFGSTSLLPTAPLNPPRVALCLFCKGHCHENGIFVWWGAST